MMSLTIPQTMEGSEGTSTWSRFLALGLALVHLGKQEGASVAKEALNVVAEPLRTFAITLLDVCAYAGQSLFFPKLLLFTLNVNYECLTTPLELFHNLCNFVFCCYLRHRKCSEDTRTAAYLFGELQARGHGGGGEGGRDRGRRENRCH